MGGRIYGPGESFEASRDEPDLLLRAGYAKKAPQPSNKKAPKARDKSSKGL